MGGFKGMVNELSTIFIDTSCSKQTCQINSRTRNPTFPPETGR